MAFSFDSSCDGKFIIDSEGIRSVDPVAIKKATWFSEDQVLQLEGPYSNNTVIFVDGRCVSNSGEENIPKEPFSVKWSRFD